MLAGSAFTLDIASDISRASSAQMFESDSLISRACGIFNNIHLKIPSRFTLIEIEVSLASSGDTQQKRRDFSNGLRKDFLKWSAQNHAQDMLGLGFEQGTIDHLARTGKLRPLERLDWSVDHILSLKFKGTNAFENLALVSPKVNRLKERLEARQSISGSGTIITLVPKQHRGQSLSATDVKAMQYIRNTCD